MRKKEEDVIFLQEKMFMYRSNLFYLAYRGKHSYHSSKPRPSRDVCENWKWKIKWSRHTCSNLYVGERKYLDSSYSPIAISTGPLEYDPSWKSKNSGQNGKYWIIHEQEDITDYNPVCQRS